MASTLFIPGTVVRSIWLNEVDKATHNALTAVAGTNAITATGPLTSVSYVTGDRFFFVPAITNTGATTININGLGVKNLTKYGVSALVAGDLVAGTAAQIYYDGAQFQLTNPQTVNVNETGRLLNVQVISVSGTYTPTAGTTRVVVEQVGGGGGGGGSTATAAGQTSVGGGGGSGSYARALFTSAFSGVTVTIGAAGAAGAVAGTGGTGGATTFGALLTTPGGIGGQAGGVFAPPYFGSAATPGGGPPTGGNIVSLSGNPADISISLSTGQIVSGGGGDSQLGLGGTPVVNSSAPGNTGSGNGAGGSGSAIGASSAGQVGGIGRAGICIVYEYS